VADYSTGDAAKHAEFVFDAPGRYVVAEDDEARWLVGEGPAAADRPAAASTPSAPPAARRLSSVGSDEELPLGEDAIELVTEAEPTVDLTATARAVRSADPAPQGDEPDAARGDADWIATQASDRPAAPTAPTAPAAPADEAEPERTPEPEAEPEQPARKSARKGRRASVPSWDEIMFGGGKQE
jgi:hypothetical protein